MLVFLLLLLGVSIVLFIKRREIQNYFDKEIDAIKELNAEPDDESKLLYEKFSTYTTETLIEMVNSGNLSEKELAAANRVLTERQAPPSSHIF